MQECYAGGLNRSIREIEHVWEVEVVRDEEVCLRFGRPVSATASITSARRRSARLLERFFPSRVLQEVVVVTSREQSAK